MADLHQTTVLPELEIEHHQDAHETVLVLRGEIDLASAPRLQLALANTFAADPSRIVVDLAGVEFIDSTGLKCLIEARERAADRSSLVLRHVPAQPRRLLELTGLADVFVTD